MFRLRALSVLAVCWFAAAVALGQSAPFETFTSDEGRFRADMPGTPQEKTEDWGEGTLGHQFSVQSGLMRFVITYADIEQELIDRFGSADEVIQTFRSGYREGRTYEDDKEFAFGERKLPGREYYIELENQVWVREQMFMDGNRLYIVFVASLDGRESLNNDSARRFLESLEIASR